MVTLDKSVVTAFRRSFDKIAFQTRLPKVNKAGLKKAKATSLDDTESHSLRRAIERSQNPEKKVLQGTQPVYAGGNTAANMRGVIRAQEKEYRESMTERFGGNSRLSKSSFYGKAR